MKTKNKATRFKENKVHKKKIEINFERINLNVLNNISFANPWFLLLLLLVPFFLFWQWKKYRQQYAEFKFSSLDAVKDNLTIKAKLRPFLNLLKTIAFALLVIAFARPQNALKEEKITTEGIDIVLVTDISGSMLAQDFQPDRLEASKNTGIEFVNARPNDRIGLVVFAGESFTQCPITTDHGVLKKLMSEIKSGLIEDGTAIGMGLATAVNRIKDSESKSKIIVLLTDGVNNKGFIDPLTAAETAKEFDIKVYTIGVGTKGMAPYPVRDLFGRTVLQNMEVQIDEELLNEIAINTGGKYFRATNNNSLQNIYGEIDRLEKTEVEVTSIKRYLELFHPLALIAALLLILDLLLRYTIFRGIF